MRVRGQLAVIESIWCVRTFNTKYEATVKILIVEESLTVSTNPMLKLTVKKRATSLS